MAFPIVIEPQIPQPYIHSKTNDAVWGHQMCVPFNKTQEKRLSLSYFSSTHVCNSYLHEVISSLISLLKKCCTLKSSSRCTSANAGFHRSAVTTFGSHPHLYGVGNFSTSHKLYCVCNYFSLSNHTQTHTRL